MSSTTATSKSRRPRRGSSRQFSIYRSKIEGDYIRRDPSPNVALKKKKMILAKDDVFLHYQVRDE